MAFSSSQFRYRSVHLLVTGLLGLFLLNAGCSRDQVTPYAADDGGYDTDVTELYAYAADTALTAGGYTYIQARGGLAPYAYSLVSGNGTVNATTGYLQVTSAGGVVVKVTDSSGDTYQVSLTVTAATGTGAACVYLGSKVEHLAGATQSRIDVTYHTQLAKQVFTGLGVRLEGNALVGIYARTAKLKADGTLSTLTAETYTYKTGDLGTTTKGEIYIDLPSGYYLTGVGLAADTSGNNTEALKVFGAKISAAGVVQSSVECLVDKNTRACTTSTNSMSAKSYYARYSEFRSAHNKPLIAWGAKISSANVASTYAASKTITTSTSDTGLCPAE